ncbi:MAG: hypothetical protein AAGA85_13185 [Bacteroidota bacterium]
MTRDFEPFLKKLHARRFDELQKQVYLSDAFLRSSFEPHMKYVLECMQPIPDRYSERLYHTSQRITDKLERDLSERTIEADFRYQGPRQTGTEVYLYGDIQVMVILPPTAETEAELAVRLLGSQIEALCAGSSLFRTVAYDQNAAVQVTTSKKPRSQIDILPCIWIDTKSYKDRSKEITRGIAEFDFVEDVRKSYLPFRNMARINRLDKRVKGNLKRLSRLLRSLQLDARESINLSSYELTCALYNMPEKRLRIEPRYILSLLPVISEYLDQLARYGMFRKVMSPSKKELIFGHDESKGGELLKLKSILDDTIIDLQDELRPLNKDLTNGFPYE